MSSPSRPLPIPQHIGPDHQQAEAPAPEAANKPKPGRAHCSRCQAACCRLIVVLQPDDQVPEDLTTHSPEGLHVLRRGEDGWCVALDRAHMNCGIYETRPSACRRFAMNGPYCKSIYAEGSVPAP